MRSTIILAVALLSGVAVAQDTPALKTQNEKVSYAMGLDLGNQLRKLSVEVDPALFARGLKDALSGNKAALTEEQVRDAISGLQAELKKKEAAGKTGSEEEDLEAAILPGYNKTAGEAFLAANKKREGVVALPSGLQYKILKQGNGKKPVESDTVVCNYRASLTDGTEFDSSYKRNQPATLAVKGVIPGWREALKLMAVGSKYQLFIPSELAYGAQGSGHTIGPNATLILEVELLAIK